MPVERWSWGPVTPLIVVALATLATSTASAAFAIFSAADCLNEAGRPELGSEIGSNPVCSGSSGGGGGGGSGGGSASGCSAPAGLCEFFPLDSFAKRTIGRASSEIPGVAPPTAPDLQDAPELAPVATPSAPPIEVPDLLPGELTPEPLLPSILDPPSAEVGPPEPLRVAVRTADSPALARVIAAPATSGVQAPQLGPAPSVRGVPPPGIGRLSEAPPSSSWFEPGPVGMAIVALLGVGAALAAPILALYNRLTRDRVIHHPLRRALLAFVVANPGASCAEAARAVGVHFTTAEHHLRILAKFGHVVAARQVAGYAYFENHGRFSPAARAELLLLRRPQNAAFVRAIREAPGIRVGELAARLGCAPSTASARASLLVRAGLLARGASGFFAVSTSPRAPPRA